MESLKLTKEQENKLLEMARKLLPEYFFDEEGEDYYIDEDGIINFLIPIKENEYKCGEIHWFEFCMRYITPALDKLYIENILNPVNPQYFKNANKTMDFPYNWNELWGDRPFYQFNNNCNGSYCKKHPIDYLYEEFKKLKL